MSQTTDFDKQKKANLFSGESSIMILTLENFDNQLDSEMRELRNKKTSLETSKAEESISPHEYPQTPRQDLSSGIGNFLDSKDESPDKQEIDKKIERIIQKYDQVGLENSNQNSTKDKIREANDKYGSPGLSNISENGGAGESGDSGFLDPDFLKFLEKVDWEKESDPARKAKKLELYKQLFEIEKDNGGDHLMKADFTKKNRLSRTSATGEKNGMVQPFSKITEEQSLESEQAKVPTMKDLNKNRESIGQELQSEKAREADQEPERRKILEIQGNYADLVRMNTSQSLKELDARGEARDSAAHDVLYQSDRLSKKAKSFLMEFENRTRTSKDQKELSVRDPNDKIKRLIQTSYSKDKRTSKREDSPSQDFSRELDNLEIESEGEGEQMESGVEEASEEQGSDIQLDEGGPGGRGDQRMRSSIDKKNRSRKFQSKKEEYQRSRESLMNDIKKHGLRGEKNGGQNFLNQEDAGAGSFGRDKRRKFLSPPKSGLRTQFKKPKQQEMNFYEQEQRQQDLANITREFYPNRTKNSRQRTKNSSNYLLDKAFKKKNYGNTFSKVDTGRFTGNYKFDKKLREHYALQGEWDMNGTMEHEYAQTYTVGNLLQNKRHMKPLHRDLKPIYDNLSYTDGIRRNQKRDFGQSGKLHRNLCWNFEEEHMQKKREILNNYYRNFDS